LDSSGPWINVNEPEVGISHNFQDMRMPTDKNIRLILQNQRPGPWVVVARRTSDVHHKHFQAFALPETILRIIVDQNTVVAVPGYALERLEISYFGSGYQSAAEISRMPDLIDGRQEIAELLVEPPVSIRKKAYKHVSLTIL
jgi:hypothetical protein